MATVLLLAIVAFWSLISGGLLLVVAAIFRWRPRGGLMLLTVIAAGIGTAITATLLLGGFSDPEASFEEVFLMSPPEGISDLKARRFGAADSTEIRMSFRATPAAKAQLKTVYDFRPATGELRARCTDLNAYEADTNGILENVATLVLIECSNENRVEATWLHSF